MKPLTINRPSVFLIQPIGRWSTRSEFPVLLSFFTSYIVYRRDSPAVRWILLPQGWTLPSVQTHLKSLLIDWWCSSSSSNKNNRLKMGVIKLYKKEALNCKTWNYIQFVLDSPVWSQTLPRLKTPKWSKIHFTNVFAQSYSSLCFSWTPQGREKFNFFCFCCSFHFSEQSMQLSERFFLNTDNPWLLPEKGFNVKSLRVFLTLSRTL